MDKKNKIIAWCINLFFYASTFTFFLCYAFYQIITLLIFFYVFLIISILVTLQTLRNRGKAYSETHKDEEKIKENKPHISIGYVPDDITEEDDYGNIRKVSEDDLWDEYEYHND